MNDVPLLDEERIADLRQLIGQQPSLGSQLLELFALQSDQLIAEVARLGQDGDPAALCALLHRLRSAAGTVGALRLSEISAAAEASSAKGEAAQPRLAEDLATARRQVLVSLRDALLT